ncbi:MAG: restriction endonuclease subunit S [Lachnospiraceae bacterium]|nr:restriction endonuclease subunit S [Lachnospiraceae bacterium]
MDKPRIRFKGYIDAWEQRKFSDFTWASGKRNKEDLDLETYAITKEHGFISQNKAHDEFGYMKDTDRKAYNIVTPNSFAYNPARINIGSIGYYEGTENVIVSSLYEVFQTSDYVDDRFLWHWFKSDEFPKWIECLQEGSVRLYFYYDKLCECQILMPSVAEQKKIATSLDHLDHLITLHQRKCDETKKLKKYMLQKMFPQKGANVPEIRFDGFTDAWEQCKFGDLGSVSMCKRIFKEQTSIIGDIPFYKIGTFGGKPDAFITRELFEEYKEKFPYPQIGDMLISASGTIGRIVEYTGENAYFQDSNIVWFKHDDKIDNLFLKCVYAVVKWSGIEGSTIRRLYNDNFLKTEFCMPQIEEQKEIGTYFSILDHIITLHQRKCENLQYIKKFMLQNMFV